MCGITGLYAFNEIGRFFSINLAKATEALAKRGPDASGTFIDHRVALGHRRLSIIDVAAHSNQPLTDHTGRYKIVFNGEIFNYQELRKKLTQKGATFLTDSDTEVLLELYKHEGESCLSQLNGFFAFAIYDLQEETFFLARDRMGIKPLLYVQDEDKLLFASEVKSLLAYGIPKELDFASLQQYLQLNYIPAPYSIFKGVQKLLPGHFLKVEKGTVTNTCWYEIPYAERNQTVLNYERQQERLVELLDESVQRRLIADVPLGAFLSGGIDSSAIVALASRHTPHLNTFSIGYRDEPFFDETKYANLVAKKFKTNHTVFSLTNDDLYEHLFEMLDYIDEPFADSSALAVYILSQKTRKKVTVALSGDGADELFGGYHKHAGEYRIRNGGMAASLIGALQPVWKAVPKSRNTVVGNKARQLLKFAEGQAMDVKERYWRFATFAGDKQAAHLLQTQADKKEMHDRKQWLLRNLRHKGPEHFNEFLLTDCQLVLSNDMLTKVDLMSMASALEVRVPFLDYQVVNFAFTLPTSSKIDNSMKKKLVQDAFREILPKQLYKRPKKGFEVPLLKWFRHELQTLITHDLLDDDFIAEQGIFNPSAINALRTKLYSANPEDVHARIWGLLVFQYWWKKYFKA
ncbi:MAG: asparagine synthase (glutamine-hydrolyzing) [Bacteroidota bacterium]